MDDRAAPRRAWFVVDHVERFEPHDFASIKCEGVSDQAINIRHGQLHHTLFCAWAWCWLLYLDELIGPVNAPCPICGKVMLFQIVAAHGFQAEQKARSNGRA